LAIYNAILDDFDANTKKLVMYGNAEKLFGLK